MKAALGQIARFELLRELGRGAQARVWLAHDPRLDREVALKLLDPTADAGELGVWLNEARAVSRLTHPHIVPVFEADEYEGQPYLVFEYVDGPTLAQKRRGQPAMAARAAVELMLDVLDALAAAHAQGVVHRDLKPSNILLGRDGRARVMDFGIAARMRHGSDALGGRIVGTPGYMSPEAARGEAPQPAMDVFASGAVLGELLAGAPLLCETDPWRAVARVQQEDLRLPAATPVDDTLRGIVHRALARDNQMRYDSARSLQAALAAWLHPVASVLPAASTDAAVGQHATVDFLLRRMRHKTDFPALSAAVVRIQRVASSDTESLQSLSEEILNDVALTNKLLRMVNTARFTAAAGGGIATVSRAVALVGFAGVRNMALSLVLLEHMGDKAHAAQLKEEFLRALMAGTLADCLTPQTRDGEDAFLGAMFQNLGRLLTEYSFPEEATRIRQLLDDDEAAAPDRQQAARSVLGVDLDELGLGVAKAWGLPATLQRALRPPLGEAPKSAVQGSADRGTERLRWLGRAANAMADAMMSSEGDEQGTPMAQAAKLYAPALGVKVADMLEAVEQARTRVSQMAQAMGVQVAPGSAARRLLDGGAAGSTGRADAATQANQRTELMSPRSTEPSGAVATATNTPHQTPLSLALCDARAALASRPHSVNEVLLLVLSTLQSALDFHRVVFCLREPGGARLAGRTALGPGAAQLSAAFNVTTGKAAAGDLFSVLCARGADLLIADARTVASRLPAWYRQHVNAATFLLLPVMHQGMAIGLIYADKPVAGTILLGEAELVCLRALRDEAATALVGGKRG